MQFSLIISAFCINSGHYSIMGRYLLCEHGYARIYFLTMFKNISLTLGGYNVMIINTKLCPNLIAPNQRVLLSKECERNNKNVKL